MGRLLDKKKKKTQNKKKTTREKEREKAFPKENSPIVSFRVSSNQTKPICATFLQGYESLSPNKLFKGILLVHQLLIECLPTKKR